jgi:hypothetical protein
VYNGPLTINNPNASNPVGTTFNSTQGDITFNGTINAGGVNQSLTATAMLGQVTFGDQVGVAAGINFIDEYMPQSGKNLKYLTVNANSILIKADITTAFEQTYNGPVLISNNGSNGLTRILLSEDPKVIFNDTVDDVLAGTHNLYVKAVTNDRSLSPEVEFNGEVGGIARLASLTVDTGIQDRSSNYGVIIVGAADAFGIISIRDNVTTSGDQIYSANSFELGSGATDQNLELTTLGGDVIFNSGLSGNQGGFTQNGAGLILSLSTDGGAVSGLSGSGVNYRVAGQLNSSSVNSSSANDLASILMADISTQILMPKDFNFIDEETGSVNVGEPELCDPNNSKEKCFEMLN